MSLGSRISNDEQVSHCKLDDDDDDDDDGDDDLSL